MLKISALQHDRFYYISHYCQIVILCYSQSYHEKICICLKDPLMNMLSNIGPTLSRARVAPSSEIRTATMSVKSEISANGITASRVLCRAMEPL
jgi:hypothetical protein